MHNLENALAAAAAAASAGVSLEQAIDAMSRFEGVKRRMERTATVADIAIYDDFAHHPTAIRLSLQALRQQVGDKRILAVLEPRSNTMRMGVHREQLAPSLGEANRVRQQSKRAQSNAISVRIELQADCFSGIWARLADAEFGTLEPGDIAEAMNAAKQIGDDTLQRNAGRVPQPHTFTHGTSEQRQRWFVRGYETGDVEVCDTFRASRL